MNGRLAVRAAVKNWHGAAVSLFSADFLYWSRQQRATRLKPARRLRGFEQVGVVSMKLTKSFVGTTFLGELDRALIVPRVRADPMEPYQPVNKAIFSKVYR